MCLPSWERCVHTLAQVYYSRLFMTDRINLDRDICSVVTGIYRVSRFRLEETRIRPSARLSTEGFEVSLRA